MKFDFIWWYGVDNGNFDVCNYGGYIYNVFVGFCVDMLKCWIWIVVYNCDVVIYIF